ncbi:cytochrome c [bacterium]|nr:cytochrome c [bacterium]MCB9477647.1 cytochrome c [Deltaproteobacteria bacterium]MCB9479839.1 cytochrome c [Deltaproteobacteria bacterium]
MPQATTHRWSKFFLLATAMMMALAATQVKAADSKIEGPMEDVGKAFKKIKKIVKDGEYEDVSTLTSFMAEKMESVKNEEPPQAKERTSEFPGLMDESIAAVKKLGEAKDYASLKASFMDMGMSCKKCHDIFQPEE